MAFNFGPWIKTATVQSPGGGGEDDHFGTGPKRLTLNSPQSGDLLLFVITEPSYSMLSTGWSHIGSIPELNSEPKGDIDLWAKISDGTEDYVRWQSNSLQMSGGTMRCRAVPYLGAPSFAGYVDEREVNNGGTGYGLGPIYNADYAPFTAQPNTLITVCGFSFTSRTIGVGATAGLPESGVYTTIFDSSGGAFKHGLTVHACRMEESTGGDPFVFQTPSGSLLGTMSVGIVLERGGWEIDKIAIGG